MNDEARLALLDPLAYSDAFDCAATLDELWRYARRPVGREELRLALRDDPLVARLAVERDGLYALAGRELLAGRRPPRLAHARVLGRRAGRVARVLRHAPFVRGLLLTGSAAADDAGDEADVDVLVVVAPGRIGTVFLLLGPASRILGRHLFCPNYYVSEEHLGLPPGDTYLAREIAQALPLVGADGALRAANPWLAEVFPNLDGPRPGSGGRAPRSLLQRVLERPLRGRAGDRLERRARRIAGSRLAAHHGELGQEVPPDVDADLAAGTALRFHGGPSRDAALARYEARLAELRRELDLAEPAYAGSST